MSVIRSQVIGCGSYLPARCVTNNDLAAQGIDTSDEWIAQRTGIRQRYIAAEGELTSDLATAAARNALKDAGVSADEVDLVIVATTSPDHTLPATASKVQANIGMTGGAAFDVQAVCSGFIYALTMADNMIRLGKAKTAIVIGAETLSRIIDWTDRTTCVLFGDGAGAFVLRAAEGEGTNADRGILTTHIHTDGQFYGALTSTGGASSSQVTGHVTMQGQEVFKQAVRRMSETVEEAMTAINITPADIDWMIPHQANSRIIEGVGQKAKIDPDKVVITVDRHGNTSAASIPLAMAQAIADGRVKKGQLLMTVAMGGGFTWGSAVIRW